MIIQNAGQFADVEPLVDEEAGTITFITTFKGLPEKIQTARGPVLLRDAGSRHASSTPSIWRRVNSSPPT